MPLRLLRYVARILDDYRTKNPRARRLPAVIPVVLAHDRRPWPYPLDLGVLYDLEHEAKQRLAIARRTSASSSTIWPPSTPRNWWRTRSPLVALTLVVFQRARHTTDLLSDLRLLSGHLAAFEDEPVSREQLATALWHIWQVGRIAPADLPEFARSHALRRVAVRGVAPRAPQSLS